MKRALVTGGAGFIGSHLVDELVSKNINVTVLEKIPAIEANNIKQHIDNKSIEYIQGSILDAKLLRETFSDAYYIFHQAAITNIDDLHNPVEYYNANTKAILNVLQAARENNVKKVIFASSCAVYGNSPGIPKREDMVPSPESPYALAKLIGEHYCQIYTKLYGLPTVCLRYFNVYGPRQNPDSPFASVIPKFIRNIKQGKPPVIFGDGEQTRDFVFVKDVVIANLLMAENKATGVFNIGRGESIKINALAKTIINHMGSNLQPVYAGANAGEIVHSWADISKARSSGYENNYGIADGLSEMK